MMGIAEQKQVSTQNIIARVRHDLSRALVLTRREVIDMLRDWRIIIPVIVLTVIFPSLANFGAGKMIAWVDQYGAGLVGERFIPFLMLVVGFFPVSFSLIIALESFVGEKERRSLEPLLSSPLTNIQIYLGKVLSSTIPPIIGSVLGITVYLVGVYFNVGYIPAFAQIGQVLLLSVMHALVMVTGAVIVSSQVTSVRASNLLASFIIIPFAFLIQGEAWVMFDAQYDVLWWALAALVILNILLIRMGIKLFNREQLLGSEIDELNLVSGAKRLWRRIWARGEGDQRRSAWQWYRHEVLEQLKVLWAPALLVIVFLIAAFFIGRQYADILVIPVGLLPDVDWYQELSTLLLNNDILGIESVGFIILQNVRTLFIGSALAVFSFGIGIILIVMVSFALVGFLIAQMGAAGMNPAILLAALLPHSLFEVTAVILAAAAAVRLGMSVLAQPGRGTLKDNWSRILADDIRLWLFLILPLLVIAGLVETLITPQVVLMVVGGA